MKARLSLLVVLLASAALAQTTPPARNTAPARPAPGKSGANLPPDPDLFDGSKFEAEKRPEMGMIGEFEMPGSENSQDSKVGGNPGAAGGAPQTAQNSPSGGAGGAQAAAGGGAAAAQQAAGSEGASGGGGQSVENAGAAGAVGGAMDQSKPAGSSGAAGGGDPNAKAEGVQADNLSGGASSAAQNAAQGGSRQKPPVSRIGSAELRIDPLPESEKDVVGREAAPGGTQGSKNAMPAGKGGQGSQNQNKGVEKGKVIPKGL